MKKRSFKNLTLNKVSISELQYKLHGGYEEQNGSQDNDADGAAPVAFTSMGFVCSIKNTCDRVCQVQSVKICPVSK